MVRMGACPCPKVWSLVPDTERLLDEWAVADPEQLVATCHSNECKGSRAAFNLWPKGQTNQKEFFQASCSECGYTLPYDRVKNDL